jgi:mercuric reductase
MELSALPESMVVIGGGPVAMEQAELFAGLGTQVTMLVRSVLARGEEPEIRDVIKDSFCRQGITVLENASPSNVELSDVGVAVVAGSTRLNAASLLMAVGRRPRTDSLGLDAVGVDVGGDGRLVVGDDLKTSNQRIWGAGDVTGGPQYVYVAASHGAMMVDNAFDAAERRVNYSALPRITFTSPALASAGLTEAQALEQGYACECRVLGLEHVPRALVSRNTHGVIKIVAETDTQKILGVHVAAEGAGDVILAASLAIQTGMTVKQLATGWNPYLTLGEGLHLAAQSFTRDPSKLSCCAA